MIDYMITLLPILSVKVLQGNRASGIYRYIGIEIKIYFKEMAQAIMGAGKFEIFR